MAIVSAAHFTGFLSGGCVESAIAAEVEGVIAEGRDRVLRFGRGSPLFDIRFPCGGGIDALVHVGLADTIIGAALEKIANRQAFGLAFIPSENRAALADPATPTGWRAEVFHRQYLPRTRLLLVGRGPELEVAARVGAAADYDVIAATPDAETAIRLGDAGITARILRGPEEDWELPIDRWTATVLLFHEREWEDPILARAIAGPGFYIGALGSKRTYAARRQRLVDAGHSDDVIDLVSGPIGLIPQARDPTTLALSVLAEIVQRRHTTKFGAST